MVSVHRDNVFFICILWLFTSCCFLTALTGTQKGVQQESGKEGRCSCLVPNIIRKALSLWPVSVMLFILNVMLLEKSFVFVFLSVLFIRIRTFFSLSLEKERLSNFVNVFLASAYTIMCFLSQSLKLVDSID